MTTPEFDNIPPVYPAPALKRESSLAIVSLIAGIVGWTILPFIGSIVAVITGHMAKKEIRESGGTMSGDGMALAGLILGYTMIGVALLVLVVIIVGLALFVPAVVGTSGIINGFWPFAW